MTTTPRSQNGLPVLFSSRRDGPLPRLRTWVIPGTGRHLILRDGCVGFLIAHFALWFHEKVERLDLRGPWDEWSWHVKPIAGQATGYSNHASASAADLNATRHPLGVHGTYTAAQRRRLMWGLRIIYRGCLRHGEFYDRRVDGMHVETNKGFSVLERNARRLCRSKRGKRILAANPGARAVIFS